VDVSAMVVQLLRLFERTQAADSEIVTLLRELTDVVVDLQGRVDHLEERVKASEASALSRSSSAPRSAEIIDLRQGTRR
jgi:hypothetical protein